ncbi:MAG: FAD-dependent monooxygenase, partial [Rhodanobacteraceae bacterium]
MAGDARRAVGPGPARASELLPSDGDGHGPHHLRRPLTREARRTSAGRGVTGHALEMSITPLHSYVCATMRAGRLFLVGDAVHVVPPTGAKGLNLAISDAKQLADGFRRYYEGHDSESLDRYGERALSRVWKAVRFSWWMTNLT